MTTEQILQLDCTEDSSNVIIQKVLKKIKPLSKFADAEEVPFWAIEKVLAVMLKKYRNIILRMMMADVNSNKQSIIWSIAIATDSLSKPTWVYGISMYEVLAKAVIFVYTQIKNEEKVE